MTKRTEYIAGLKSAVPVIFGFIPVGIAYALMARQAGFDVLETCLMSITVFAGASQMMAVGMYAQGAGILAIILATFLLNLRHFIMSTCVMNKMHNAPKPAKIAGAFGVTDESFAIFTTKKEHSSLAYFLGLVTVTYLSWNLGTLIGAVTSDFLPEILTASFGIALYAMFIGLISPGLHGNKRLCLLVLLTAVCNTLLCLVIPQSWALIISALICAGAGVFFVDLGGEDDNR